MKSSDYMSEVYFGVMLFWTFLGIFTIIIYKLKSQVKLLKLDVTEYHKIKEILDRNFKYFQNLNDNEKDLFIRRVNTFLKMKKWIGKNDLSVDLHKRVIISASAIQLTFGLETFLMPHFTTIEVYPDIYLNTRTGNRHKGEVNSFGLVRLSWNYFEAGYEKDDDKINLGLHEMAHALDISSLTKTSEYLMYLFARFRLNYKENYYKFLDGKFKFLREYGKDNQREFFAVLIETYFENPKELHENIPDLYLDLCFLLNQDILHNINRDFIGKLESLKVKCGKIFNYKNSDILLKTKFNKNRIIITSLPFIFISLIVGINVKQEDGGLFLILFFTISYFIAVAIQYFMSSKFILTQDFLVIKNKLNRLNTCIDLFEIIAIVYDLNNITIAYYKNSKYHKLELKVYEDKTEIGDLLLYLGKTQILVNYRKYN
jgi:Mlc titration factor MtfA (ptsG expression regulator)